MIEIGMLFGVYMWTSVIMTEVVYKQAMLHNWRLNLACEVYAHEKASHKRMSARGLCMSAKRSGRAQRRAERVAR